MGTEQVSAVVNCEQLQTGRPQDFSWVRGPVHGAPLPMGSERMERVLVEMPSQTDEHGLQADHAVYWQSWGRRLQPSMTSQVHEEFSRQSSRVGA